MNENNQFSHGFYHNLLLIYKDILHLQFRARQKDKHVLLGVAEEIGCRLRSKRQQAGITSSYAADFIPRRTFMGIINPSGIEKLYVLYVSLPHIVTGIAVTGFILRENAFTCPDCSRPKSQ